MRRHVFAASCRCRLVACAAPPQSCAFLGQLDLAGGGDRIASRLNLRRAIRIVELPHIDVPLVVGCLRPSVVLPIAAIAQLDAAQVEAILAHELAHVRRHDYLVNLMQTLAETLLFYHPAVWWLSARIRDEREHCCDDVAVAVCGDPVGYAAALTELEAWRSRELSLAAAATGGSLLIRVRRILRVEISEDSRTSPWTVAIAVARSCGRADAHCHRAGASPRGAVVRGCVCSPEHVGRHKVDGADSPRRPVHRDQRSGSFVDHRIPTACSHSSSSVRRTGSRRRGSTSSRKPRANLSLRNLVTHRRKCN